VQRHEALYGPAPNELVEAMGVERPKTPGTPEIPVRVAKRLRRRRPERLAVCSFS
jgi:hypothetical protein